MLQKIVFGIFIISVTALLSILTALFYVRVNTQDKIFPQTYIDDVDVSLLSKSLAYEKIAKKYPDYKKINIEVLYKNEKIATLSGEQLNLARNVSEKVDQAFLIGRSTHLPSQLAQQLNSILKIRKYDFYTDITYNKEEIDSFVAYAKDTYDMPPQDALFDFQNNRVVSFQIDKPGVMLKTDVFLSDLKNTLNSSNSDTNLLTVTLEDEEIAPNVTLSQSNNFGIEDLIGEGKSNYTGSIPTRIHNLKLAGSKFHGIIIPKGEVFSFNSLVGEISSRTGYQPAYIIQNGRTVLGDGGGVCQVSTTIFRAALNSGLPILSRTAHGYRVSYYENNSEPGLDATVFSPSVDLKFENDTEAAILIQLFIDEAKKEMVYKFYGKNDGRGVNISKVTVWDVSSPPAALYQDDPTLPAGKTKQVDWAAWGAKTKFEYKVTAKDGRLMQDKTFYSNYRPWRAIFLKGTGGV